LWWEVREVDVVHPDWRARRTDAAIDAVLDAELVLPAVPHCFAIVAVDRVLEAANLVIASHAAGKTGMNLAVNELL